MDLNCVNSTKQIIRPLAKFHPDIWGDRFLNYTPPDEVTLGQMKQEVEKLKELVRKELLEVRKEPKERIEFIDAMHRLGVAYHFENDIQNYLQKFHNNFNYLANYYKDDLQYVSLSFRLLRQHGFYVSSDVFEKFKCENGRFKECLTSDIEGLLNLYEASYVGVHGENIVDEALTFCSTHLSSIVEELRSSMAEQVSHSLKLPLHRRSLRLESKNQISFYESNPSHNKTLLRFAKLDFNLLQVLHNTELRDFTSWDESCIDQLPDYMKLFYQAILDTVEEIEQDLAKEGRSYAIHYLKQQMLATCQGYLQEAKWCQEKFVPTYEDYVKNGILSSGYLFIFVVSYLGMGEIASKDSFEWTHKNSRAPKASCIFTRLLNDISSHKFEQKREHVTTGVECYMGQFGASEEEAYREIQMQMEEAWKDMNMDMLTQNSVRMPIIQRIINLSRVLHDFYQIGEDCYTMNKYLQPKINAILIDPFKV
ncbi:unnamed protein product [Amaranthus hypochondriacus]